MSVEIEHHAEVQEVVDFLRSGRLLRPRSADASSFGTDVLVIRSLDDVERYRQEPPDLGEDEEPPLVWLDILKQEEPRYYSERRDILGPRYKEFDAALDKLWTEACALIEAQLIGMMPQYEIEEVQGYFNLILRHRALYGHGRGMIERLFQVYLRGGYPCGWAGHYPEGSLVVYAPPAKAL